MAKPMVILSINAGSSSVKATLFKADNHQPEKIEISWLSSPPAQFFYQCNRNSSEHHQELPDTITSHNDAFQYILESFLNDKDLEVVSYRDHIDYAYHRVVHGVSRRSNTRPIRQGRFATLIDVGRVITPSKS
jgi:acetate kinase